MNTSGKQSIVLVLSGLLVIAHLWQDTSLQQIGNAVMNTGVSGGGAAGPNTVAGFGLQPPVKDVLVSLVFVAAMTWLAGISDDFGTMSVALVIIIWTAFLINTKGHPFTPGG